MRLLGKSRIAGKYSIQYIFSHGISKEFDKIESRTLSLRDCLGLSHEILVSFLFIRIDMKFVDGQEQAIILKTFS
jgi:hypothetical protein